MCEWAVTEKFFLTSFKIQHEVISLHTQLTATKRRGRETELTCKIQGLFYLFIEHKVTGNSK